MDYKGAGVNIAAGEAAVVRIRDIVRRTYNANVLGGVGNFGGLYAIDLHQWRNPVLVSSTDGVGTKVLVASMAERYASVGQDLVNHCVNDILAMGAVPQFFQDYIGMWRMEPTLIEQLITGMTVACLENEVSLVGGEMAEMPDIYRVRDFDLVGTIVGLVEREDVITGAGIVEGDVVLGFMSNGLHTNGYSLARKIVFEQVGFEVDTEIAELGISVADALLSVHKSYYPTLRPWLRGGVIHGMAHITGGGIEGNVRRIIPQGLCAFIDMGSWDIPPLFSWLIARGELTMPSAFQAFNMGIGFIVITPRELADVLTIEAGALPIGIIGKVSGEQRVVLEKKSK